MEKRRSGQRQVSMGVNLGALFLNHLFHQAEGELTIFPRFTGKTKYKIHMGHETGLADPTGCSQGLLRRMPPVELGKKGITAGLGP